MQTTIDGGGRVVIPKAMRDRLGLAPGRSVDVEMVGDDVVIRASTSPVALREVDGVLVAEGPASGEVVWSAEAERELLEAVRSRHE